MKKICLFLLFGLLLVFGLKDASAQYLRIKFQDGTEEINETDLLQSLKFPDNLLQINFLSGVTESYELSTVKTLYLQQYPTAAEDYLMNDEAEITVYPNPASDVIYMKNAPETSTIVSIYRIDGALILQKQISSQNKAINISELTSGLYVIKIDNQALKFIKQ